MADIPKTHDAEPASVLIVDDNYALLEVLRERLDLWGYQVSVATGGEEAIEALKTGRFHVLLADLRMSPVSGWEVIRLAREESDTQVIVMTGFVSLDSSLEALRQRVFDFLSKPLDFDRLERALHNAAQQCELGRENKRLFEELAGKANELEVEVQKVRAELEEVTFRDELTGLYNYRFLMGVLEREIGRSLRYGHPLSFAMIDLDFFKQLNDTRGHTEGNEALRRVATVLERETRSSDYVCRYGGEEFAILFPDTPKDRIEPVLRRIGEKVKAERILAGKNRFLTLSAGLACCPDNAQTRDELIQAADSALYKAKDAGRDTLVLA